jgi:hypothetical protein
MQQVYEQRSPDTRHQNSDFSRNQSWDRMGFQVENKQAGSCWNPPVESTMGEY